MSKVEQSVITVAIGASAGGLEAFKVFFECLPVETGLSFVIIQHLATGQESMLTEILSRFTKIPVQVVKDGLLVEPDHVYVIPPGETMTIEKHVLKLTPKGKSLKPIDTFFVSLAEDLKSQSIGIVLSGTGSDGTEGLKAIKAQGGITFAQTPDSAQYGDMPQSAISAEATDFVLSPDKIALELQKIAKNPHLARKEIATRDESGLKEEKPTKEKGLNAIFTMLKSNCNIDFSHYKETVVNRRVTRRMVINHIEKMDNYTKFLRTHPNELEALFNDMLIGVTSFFREPETFVALKETVFPSLVKNRQPKEPIRVWIPACSTGEEAYSFAIAIQEYLEENSASDLEVQIFGTDVNEKNIEKARQGIYPPTIETDINEKRLKHFFKTSNGNYQISKPIRDKCIFAKQDITADPPFSNMDLISCRNMLIYFDEYLHEKVVPTLHYALKMGGFLVIGQSESIGKFTQLFESVNKRGAIYVKKRAQPKVTFGLQASAPYLKRKEGKEGEKADVLSVLKDEVDHLLVTEYVPAALLVNSDLDVLIFRGNIAPYVLPESGLASLNLARIIRKELGSEVQTIIYRARKEDKLVKENAIRFEYAGDQKTINVQVLPIHVEQYVAPFFLLLFEDVSSAAALLRKTMELNITPEGRENVKDHQNRELREELDSTKQTLQRVIETQEATDEELRTTLEEAQSSNEELQSTNEELETAKEELQSSNEELKTLNDEVKNRNQALAQLNDDLTNLNRNVDPAIVIIDKGLKIRLFSPSAQKILNLSPSTVGIPITTIKLSVMVEDLGEIISGVISKLSGFTKEVNDAKGHYYEMRIQPYITQDDRIDGAVLAFSDITERKTRNDREIESLAKFPSEDPNPVFRIDRKGTILFGNQAASSLLFEWNSKVGEQAPDQIRRIVTEVLANNERTEIEETFGAKTFSLLFAPITVGGYVNIYGKDITERKKAEEALRKQASLIDLSPDAIIGKKLDDTITFWSQGAQNLYGWTEKEALGQKSRSLLKTKFPESYHVIVKALLSEGRWSGEKIHQDKFGHEIIVDSRWLASCNKQNEIEEILETNVDITKRKKLEAETQRLLGVVQQERDRAQSLLNSINDEVWFADTEKKFTLANPSAIKEFKLDSSDQNVDVENLAATSEVYRPDGSLRPVEEAPPLRALKGEIVRNQEEIVRTPLKGEMRTRQVSSAPVRNASGIIVGSVSVVRDVTDLKKAEEALKENERLYHTVFDNSQDGFQLIELIYDKKGKPIDHKFLKVNHAYEKIIGVKAEDILDKTAKFISPNQEPHWLEVPDRVAKTGISEHIELYNKDINKTLDCHYFLYSKNVIGTLFRDITKRKLLEKQFHDQERLAAIGATAGMVGHDIRNPLQAITGDVYLLREEIKGMPECEEKSSAEESLEGIEKNVDYINKIVADLQDYARPLKPNAEETDIKLVVDELLKKNGLPENVRVSVNVESDATKVLADSTFINRIMYNLVNNAVQAMSKGGKLTIHAFREANDILITVNDTGVGIPESVKGKLFTPMFTTKSKGQGFGLAVIKRMTEALGGTVSFESQEGKGTTFIIRLPPHSS